MTPDDKRGTIAAELRAAGCIAAEEEAEELTSAAAGDAARLQELVARRCTGEPLAWLTGSVTFCGQTVLVHPDVYVPRWQSEPLALEAAARLPEHGTAVDFCTGAGAVAAVLARLRPLARILATEIDPTAVACARRNGLEVFQGDMSASLPPTLVGQVDVVTAIVPYVPTWELSFLPRDVTTYEPHLALDGGADGTLLLRRAVLEAGPLLRPGGSLLLELGGQEADLLQPLLTAGGYWDVQRRHDEDGDLRAVFCRRR
ncbi:MAG: methyltransferase [Candidatus Dormibacteraeota bacterium]|nr:methyltransferase [Candidatus Dormibacteraeota bacterium]